MNAQDYWQVFLETGAPEMYLFYNKARKMEESNVPDCSGPCPEGHSIQ